jgi:hypothetical protein
LLEGNVHEALIRNLYQGAIPALALMQLAIGFGHLRIAWLMLEHDWDRVMRMAGLTLAAAITLVMFMGVLFLNGTQAVLQGVVVIVELGTIAMIAHHHTQLFPDAVTERG